MNADHPSIDKSKKASYLTQLLAGRSQGTPCPGTVQAAVPVAARAVICRLPGTSWSTSKLINVTISRKPRLLAALASPQSSLDLSQYLTRVHHSGPREVMGGPTVCSSRCHLFRGRHQAQPTLKGTGSGLEKRSFEEFMAA